MKRDYRQIVARWYYFATPVFILLDYLTGISVRVAALDSMPLYKNLYYGFCIICALGIYIFPRRSAIVAVFESTINLIMIIFVLFAPYVHFLAQLDYDDVLDALDAIPEVTEAFTFHRIVNFLFAGLIAVFAFRSSVWKLEAASRPTEPTSNDSPDSGAD